MKKILFLILIISFFSQLQAQEIETVNPNIASYNPNWACQQGGRSCNQISVIPNTVSSNAVNKTSTTPLEQEYLNTIPLGTDDPGTFLIKRQKQKAILNLLKIKN